MIEYLKFYENVRFGFHKYFIFKISLMLISIFSCDNNSRTISKWPLSTAKNNAISLNVQIKFYK